MEDSDRPEELASMKKAWATQGHRQQGDMLIFNRELPQEEV